MFRRERWQTGWVDVSAVAAVYAAGLSTAIALAQGINWQLNKPRLEVSARLAWRPLRQDERESARGTPLVVKRGHDDLLEEVLVSMTVRNRGGKPVQVSSLLIETFSEQKLSSKEVLPRPLPLTLEPASAIEVSVQKEFLDEATAVTFIGVLDALGRRHGVKDEQARALIQSCWALPTRVASYQRRDDATHRVRAFRATDRFGLSQRTVTKRPKILADRVDVVGQPVVPAGSSAPRTDEEV